MASVSPVTSPRVDATMARQVITSSAYCVEKQLGKVYIACEPGKQQPDVYRRKVATAYTNQKPCHKNSFMGKKHKLFMVPYWLNEGLW